MLWCWRWKESEASGSSGANACKIAAFLRIHTWKKLSANSKKMFFSCQNTQTQQRIYYWSFRVRICFLGNNEEEIIHTQPKKQVSLLFFFPSFFSLLSWAVASGWHKQDEGKKNKTTSRWNKRRGRENPPPLRPGSVWQAQRCPALEHGFFISWI